MKFRADKKIIWGLLICAVAIATFGFSVNTSFAQEAALTPFTSIIGKAAGAITEVGTTVLAAYGVLAVLQAALTYILPFVSYILDNIFFYNTILTPINIGVVGVGWGVMRDVANAFFILILLWIAFTIIFNLEHLGGKKLLVRVMVVALLVNFSLVAVSSVFSFANALARPFQKAIGDTDVAGLIIGKTKLHTITNSLNQSQAVQLKESVREQERNEPRKPEDVGVEQVLLTPAEPRTAHAQTRGGIAALGCGLGALLGLGVASAPGCVGGAIAFAALDAVLSTFFTVGAIVVSWKAIPTLLVSNIFLLITIFAFSVVGVVLIARLVAMVFLAVLAPAALMLSIIPGKISGEWWNTWVKHLVSWAFFAPAFYFLLWLSLLVLDNMSSVLPENNIFSGSANAILVYVVFLGFLFGAIKVAKEMGITVADRMVELGKGVGWAALGGIGGAALGGLKTAGFAAMRRIPGMQEGGGVQQALRKASEIPGLRVITGMPHRTYMAQLEAQKKRVEERAEALAPYSTEDKLAFHNRALFAEDKIGSAKSLKKDFGKLAPSDQKQTLDLASRIGMQNEFLQYRPDLIRQEHFKDATSDRDAFEKFMAKMKTKEIETIAWDAVGNMMQDVTKEVFKKGPEAMKAFAQSMMQQKQETRTEMQHIFQNVAGTDMNWGELAAKDPAMHEANLSYIVSNMGKKLMGGNVPPFLVRQAKEKGYVKETTKQEQPGKTLMGGKTPPFRVRQTKETIEPGQPMAEEFETPPPEEGGGGGEGEKK